MDLPSDPSKNDFIDECSEFGINPSDPDAQIDLREALSVEQASRQYNIYFNKTR